MENINETLNNFRGLLDRLNTKIATTSPDCFNHARARKMARQVRDVIVSLEKLQTL